jgi:hypothetical protein
MNPELTAPDNETRFQCRHIFTDGHRCGSPALRGPEGPESFCYYHHNSRRPIQHEPTRKRRQSRFTLPNPCELSDRSGIQASIGEVLRRIASNEIDPRRAGLLLYGLQIASLNLPKSTPREQAAEPVSEVTHDAKHGLLAPPAELHANEPKSSVQLLLEQFDNTPTIDLHASAEAPTTTDHPAKSTPNFIRMKTLRKKVRGMGLRRALCVRQRKAIQSLRPAGYTTAFGRAEGMCAVEGRSEKTKRGKMPRFAWTEFGANRWFQR